MLNRNENTALRTKRLKAGALLFFLSAAFVLVQLSPVRDWLKPQVMEDVIRSAGLWGPAAYMLFCFVGSCLFFPGTVSIALGVALFGPYRGFLYLWIAALAASALSFHLSRTLGRDFTASGIAGRLARYDDLISRNGLTAVLYLRLMCFPFAPTNYAMGLTRVRFWDYFLGTALGLAVTIFLIASFIGVLRGIWITGQWERLYSYEVILPLGLIGFSLFLPRIIDKTRCKRASRKSASTAMR